MTIYHGSTLPIDNPVIDPLNVGRDFGPAFYTTTIQAQAERWAKRKCIIYKNHADILPVVSVYEFDIEKAKVDLNILEFTSASMEWIELVIRCRKEPNFKHSYDVVIGQVADDRVGTVVNLVTDGILSKEEALPKIKFQHDNNQIAFCSTKALQYLKFLRSYSI